VGHFNGPRATRAAFSPGRAMGSPPPLLFPRRARLGCGLWPLILFRMYYSPWTDMLVGLYIFATRLYRSGRLRAARANGPGHLRTAGRGSGPWPVRPPGRAARSPQSADRAGPGTGPLLRAMDRAADHGPNGQLYPGVADVEKCTNVLHNIFTVAAWCTIYMYLDKDYIRNMTCYTNQT
jgi:hypothetical protein